jgi:hypothetical protein
MGGAQEARNNKSRTITEILECNGFSLQYGSLPCDRDEFRDSIELNFFMD